MEDFSSGEDILAKWSGSRKLVPGKILKVYQKTVEVQFEDGSKQNLKTTDVKKVKNSPKTNSLRSSSKSRSKSKSPARSQKSSPQKSRSRSPRKSPSRGRSPSKSPGRKAPQKRSPTASPKKSPARSSRSPGRPVGSTKKSPARKSPSSPARKLGRPPKKLSLSPPSPKAKKHVSILESPPIATLRRSQTKVKQVQQTAEFQKIIGSGSMLPSVNLKNIFDSKSLQAFGAPQEEKIFSTRLRVQKSQENWKEEENKSLIILPEPKKKISFLGSLVSLFILLSLPIYSCFLILACVKNNGKLLGVPYIPKIWRAYISPIPLAIYSAFAASQLLLGLLPFGKVVQGFTDLCQIPRQKLNYRINSLVSLLVTISLLPLYVYYELPWDYITLHFMHFACSAVLLSLILSLVLYVKSFYADPGQINSMADSGLFYHDVVVGRELNPRFGNIFDVKFFVTRFGRTSLLVVNLLLLYKCYSVHGCIHFTMAVSAAMQILATIAAFWREETYLASSSVMYEGLGYKHIVGLLTIQPFTVSIPVLYLLNNKFVLPYYCLAPMGLLFLIGFYLVESAARNVYLIKRNPHSTRAKALQTISCGRKSLIVSGSHSWVRHPNYLGEIIMNLAWTLPCGFSVGVPYVHVGLLVLVLTWRTHVMEKHMEQSYGSAWQDYKKQVPSRIIPFLF